MTAIAITNLTVRFGTLTALDDVSMDAAAGRLTAVLGPNASGKSTLLRCVIGALKPTRGAARFGGSSGPHAHRMRPRELAARAAYVPQRSVVSAGFSVREIVELGRYALPPDTSRVDDAMARLDVMELADRVYGTLSVGQQQRATVARAVAQLGDDGCLVMDEPVSAMDLWHVRSCFRLFRELAAGGATIIVAMHDLALAAEVADDAWLLDGGRLVAAGAVRDVLTPEKLHEVFRVPFQWVTDGEGRARLLPDAAATGGSGPAPRAAEAGGESS